MSSLIGSIASQLGDTNGLLEKAIEEAALEELDFELACDSTCHAQGREGHSPDQAATWMVRPPCGQELMSCDAWVKDTITNHPRFMCVCRTAHKTADCSFIPLAQTGGES